MKKLELLSLAAILMLLGSCDFLLNSDDIRFTPTSETSEVSSLDESSSLEESLVSSDLSEENSSLESSENSEEPTSLDE